MSSSTPTPSADPLASAPLARQPRMKEQLAEATAASKGAKKGKKKKPRKAGPAASPAGSKPFLYTFDTPTTQTGSTTLTILYTQSPAAIIAWLNTHSRHGFMGLDTETKPSFRKGQRHPTALLQLATPTCHVLLLPILQMSKKDRELIKPHLAQLLSNPAVKKCGVDIWNDIKTMVADWNLDVDLQTDCGYVDIKALAEKDILRFPPPPETESPEHPWIMHKDGVRRPPIMKYGLKSLLERYLQVTMSKACQMSNWGMPYPMQTKMAHYASLDAWAGMQIFANIREHMDQAEFDEHVASQKHAHHGFKKLKEPRSMKLKRKQPPAEGTASDAVVEKKAKEVEKERKTKEQQETENIVIPTAVVPEVVPGDVIPL
ncbi:ribonuclease H-like domain-containing protein [Powellomyces hirtus]|nr:ribonuclease H-like domain-containing protein [Powellomyces hirtus]